MTGKQGRVPEPGRVNAYGAFARQDGETQCRPVNGHAGWYFNAYGPSPSIGGETRRRSVNGYAGWSQPFAFFARSTAATISD